MTIHKHGSAHWSGDIKRGKGTVSTESGVLNQQPYGFNTRFEGEKGTNPEELIGAAHAACFSMALSLMLGEAGYTADSIDTTADVSLDKTDSGFAISKIALKSKVTVPALDPQQFDGVIQESQSRMSGFSGAECRDYARLYPELILSAGHYARLSLHRLWKHLHQPLQ
ncbi:Peroxiredoxin osmC [Leclercia adecarboxylata]|uniref:Peroxiredoxin osmC n=6 Tax=Enterobacterales TaxID=91347 RepID=A0A4U9HV39_9ENTR|nr:Peroxiredoxin osmC [Leclercia adecarboxylata]